MYTLPSQREFGPPVVVLARPAQLHRALEENFNIPAGLSQGYIHACPMGKELSHFLARGHFLLPYEQFPRPARKSTCPGPPHGTFFEP